MTKQEIISELSAIVRNSLQAHGYSYKLATDKEIEYNGKKYNYIYESAFSELPQDKGKLFVSLKVWENTWESGKQVLAEDLTEEQLAGILESTKRLMKK